MNSVLKGPVYIGSDTPEYLDQSLSFDGSISCLQFFDYDLDSPTMALKKYCQDLPKEKTVKPCPLEYEFYDDWCYKISVSVANFATAEMRCLPDKDDPYETQLMYSENPRHWAYIANLMKKQLEIDTTLIFWAGFSDRAEDGFGSTSFGDNITLDTTDIITSGLQCGIAGTVKSRVLTRLI